MTFGFGGSGNRISVDIVGDASDFERESQKVQKSSQGIRDTLKKYSGEIKTFLAFQATNAVKDFVFSSVDAFSDLEQAVGGSEAVFGEFESRIAEVAETAADSMGLSESAFRTATTSIGGQLKRMTGDVELATEESIKLVEVGADLAATYGGTTAEAVAALGAAFRGEADPAERFNLNLKIGQQNAKAVELGLADATSEVDEHARAQATIALIMEQSADAQGQFAREADTTAGKEQRLTAEIENQKAALGQGLTPAYLAFLQMGNQLLPFLGRVAQGFAEATGAITFAELQLSRIESEMGVSRDTAEALGTAIVEIDRDASKWWMNAEHNTQAFTQGLKDLMAASDPTGRELERLIDLVPFLVESMGLSEERGQELADFLQDELAGSFDEARGAAHDFARGGARAARQARDDIVPSLYDIWVQARDAAERIDAIEGALKRLGNVDWRAVLAGVPNVVAGLEHPFFEGGFITDQPRQQTRPRSGSGDTGAARDAGAFHTGGRVNAPVGQEVMIRALGGEEISNGRGGSGPTVVIQNVYGFDDFVEKVRDAGIEIERLGLNQS